MPSAREIRSNPLAVRQPGQREHRDLGPEPAEPPRRGDRQMALPHARLGEHEAAPLPLADEPFQAGQRLVVRGGRVERGRLEHAGERCRGGSVTIAYHAAECSGGTVVGQDEKTRGFPACADLTRPPSREVAR